MRTLRESRVSWKGKIYALRSLSARVVDSEDDLGQVTRDSLKLEEKGGASCQLGARRVGIKGLASIQGMFFSLQSQFCQCLNLTQ